MPDAVMKHDTIPGLEKTMSRLVMGCDNQPDLPHASAIFDHFYSVGGNAFDTGYIYGDGRQERLLGQWMADRGVREDVVVIVKGAHTPHCDPESLTSQLLESLERQQSEYADIYLMHRDNPEIPVGEFVDVLDEHHRAGRVKVFGGSNWTRERFEEANAYARAHGKQEFTVLSNHFGLAEAYDVPWAGCEHVTDPASKQWLIEAQTPLLPWSSQARGFFARPATRMTSATLSSSGATTATTTSSVCVGPRSSEPRSGCRPPPSRWRSSWVSPSRPSRSSGRGRRRDPVLDAGARGRADRGAAGLARPRALGPRRRWGS